MLFPLGLLILSKVAGEGFLAPVTVDWVRDGRKCRDRFVHAWVLEELRVLVRRACTRA